MPDNLQSSGGSQILGEPIFKHAFATIRTLAGQAMRISLLAASVLAAALCASTARAQVQAQPFRGSGEIVSVADGQIVMKTAAGKQVSLKLPADGKDFVDINGKYRFRANAKVKVAGKLPREAVSKGNLLQLEAVVDRLGRIDQPVATFQVVDSKSAQPGAKLAEGADAGDKERKLILVGELLVMRNDRFVLRLPKGSVLRSGRVSGPVAKDAVFKVQSSRYQLAGPGDKITVSDAARVEGKDVYVRAAKITLTGKRETPAVAAEQSDIDPKYARLSAAPRQPRTVRTRNFILHTDLSDRSAQMLADKLETMRALIMAYYGRNNSGVVEIYVVRDLSQWPEGTFPPEAVAKISEPAGVTLSRGLGDFRKSVAYSCDDHGVAQHEAVHALCFQTFGGAGPSWYAEGMAEMGQYWKKGQLAVDVNPMVINYLTSQKPRSMRTIVNPEDPPGSWQDYAWRWALCHLLANNPNYNQHFKALGIGLMEKRQGASFQAVYGGAAREILFEYDFFLRKLANGVRADLIAWDWKTKNFPLAPNGKKSVRIDARRGWQASRVRVAKGRTYEFATSGTWKLSDDGPAIDAAGQKDGGGKLVGILMDDYELSKPFEIGKYGKFTAPQNGDLYLRCRDQWNALEDNDGQVNVTITAPEE